MKTTNIHQSVLIDAPVATVFRTLMNARRMARITGARYVISKRPGSRFSAWDDDITGFTVHVERNERIVQAWRSDHWEAGHYSIADFQLRKAGRATRLTFDHYAVPSAHRKNIAIGWKDYYWEPLKAAVGRATSRK